MDSPVGRLKLVTSAAGLVAVLWSSDDDGHRVPLADLVESSDNAMLLEAQSQLNEYFAGTRTEFSVPLDMRGTPFQKQVWQLLTEIPFGETRTYGQLAAQLGSALVTRAVGAANGRNPISIIVPCHRVIGASGKLTGFAGGLEVKEQLLHLESEGQRLF
jgi:methylated-DNA-[protein]-cysteine S-methyltransferase